MPATVRHCEGACQHFGKYNCKTADNSTTGLNLSTAVVSLSKNKPHPHFEELADSGK